ncbi:MAG: hypothetical protein RL458_1355 [Pseudomonadota bacterium]|jgi:Protein of unknown function (DUF1566)
MMNWPFDLRRLFQPRNVSRSFGRAFSLRRFLDVPKALRAAGASVFAAVVVAGCGGGGGGGTSDFLVTVDGSTAALSGRFEGGDVVLKNISDNSTIASSSASGTYRIPGFKDPVSSSTVIVDRHPINQLCIVRSGAAELSMRLECVPKRLNDTGLVTCRSGASCPTEDAGSGRDAITAQLRKVGSALSPLGFDYTRLCNNGQEEGGPECKLTAESTPGTELRDWGCTRDNHTGLVWRVVGYGTRSTFAEARDRVATIQEQNWCGRAGWNLPTAHQLQSVLNSAGPVQGTYRIAASLAFLPSFNFSARNQAAQQTPTDLVDMSGFWSSDSAFNNAGNAWAVSFEGAGRVVLHPADRALYLAPVSTADFPQRFSDPYHSLDRWQFDAKAGTLLDRRSGLMWMVCSAGRSYNAATGACDGAGAFTFDQALARPAAVNAGAAAVNGGYADWRLPNRAELGSLIDHQQRAPAVSSDNALTLALRQDLGVSPGAYWTSSWVPRAGSGGDVFVVDFVDGLIGLAPQLDLQLRVRLVRDAR